MTRIHPTAIVDPGAQLAEDVEVGAYSLVGPHVRIGAGTRISSHVVLDGHTSLGRDNLIAPFCSLGGPPQDKKYAGEPTQLEIGDRNVVREYCYFNPGTVQDDSLTRLGSDNWIMGYVHIAHDCMIGDHTIIANGTQLAGHVHLGDWVFLGGLTGVHQFVKVGAHAMSSANSYLSQDVPPFVTAAGSPAGAHGINTEGLRRRGFSASQIASVKQAYKLLYRSQLSLEEARAAIAQLIEDSTDPGHLQLMVDFLHAATRGIIR